MLSINEAKMINSVLEGILWGVFVFVIILGIAYGATWLKEPWAITLKKLKPKHLETGKKCQK